MIDNTNGRKWARFTLALSLTASVAGNITHTVLAASTISLGLRVPGAVLWPVFTFLGIEVLVRIIWERSFTHRLARNMVLFPAIPAAIVSYEHLHGLLLMMGEDRFIAMIGPLAIDGAMIGCTMALLFTRATPALPDEPPAETVTEPKAWFVAEDGESVVPAKIALPPAEKRVPSGQKSAAMEKAVRLMLEGRRQEAVDSGLIGDSTLRRYEKVRKVLRDDALAEIDCKAQKVQPHLIEIMRQELKMERAQ